MQKIDPENRFEKLFNKLNKKFKFVQKAWNFVLLFLIFLLLVEFTSFLLIKTIHFSSGGYYNSILDREVYKDSEWAKDYLQEAASIKSEYYPYIGYRRVGNFSGAYINLDEESRRNRNHPQTSH